MNKVALDTMVDVLARPMKEGVAIDGGANVGHWTQAMCGKFKKVYAFEPNPTAFAMLKKNTAKLEGASIEQKALAWVTDHKVRMGLRLPDKLGTSRIASVGSGSDVVSIDKMFAGKDVAFMKLDLEGFEYYALRGAAQTLFRCKPTVLIEEKDGLSEFFGIPTGEARRWLESIGMKVAKRYQIDVLMEWS